MSAPSKFYVVLPVESSINYTGITSLAKYATLEAATTACVKAAVSTGVQYVVLDAICYSEPEIPQAVVDALVLPIV